MTDPLPSLRSLARGYADGSLSPVDVTETCLARIDALDDKLGAFQVVYAGEARDAAAAAAAAIRTGHRVGPFHGVPFALKDIIDLEGRVTTGGSKAYADRISPTTATIARRLLGAGGILLGKTKTVEFAFGGWGNNQHMGTPWNPWDDRVHRAPGGSSSGSAVAVAARLAACAVGTDTGGSVRLPAAWCGITGLKVTEGQLPTDGILPLSHTLDTPGPLARSVDDARIMYRVMAGVEGHVIDHELAGSSGTASRPWRLGCLIDAERAAVAPDVLARYDATLDTLVAAGAQIAPLALPISFAEVLSKSSIISHAEAYVHHGALFEAGTALHDEAVRERVLAGRDARAEPYVRALVDRPALTSAYVRSLEGCDALLTPTTTTVAPVVEGLDQTVTPAHFTRVVNYLGLCALSLPCGLTDEGLPAGIQVVGRPHEEQLVCAIGEHVENLLGPLPMPVLAS